VAITASAGVAVAPEDASTVAALFKAADDCLLAAKAQGKDRVVLRVA
jgi:PleD family two-component response regulator